MSPSGDSGNVVRGRNKRLLLVLAVVAVVVVLAAVGTVATLVLGGSRTTFAVGDCVKESPTGKAGNSKAIKAGCSDTKAYRVINKVGDKSECADTSQPFVVVQTKGSKDQVLCLRPASQK
jgi:hypothetical protein